MKKKFLSLLLSAAVVLSMVLPASATFTDIADTQTRQQVSVLQMLGVIDGTSANTFSPNGTLTRAQFCKMAVILMGRESEEPLYRNRTIFPDVKSTHWARGYINLAVSVDVGGTTGEDGQTTGGVKLIRGMADGTFRPDRAITYAEAVTILLRMLGYSDNDAGMNWPNGYLELAGKLGLTAGINRTANQSLTRAEAAKLFYTTLSTKQKSGTPYYNQLGTPQADVVVTNANAKAEDSTTGAMGTSAGVFKLAKGTVPVELVGQRGLLLTKKNGIAVAFLPKGNQKTITVSQADAAWVIDSNNVRHEIPAEGKAYTPTENTTYDKVWMSLRTGSRMTLYYSESGKVEAVFCGTAMADTAAVALEGSTAPFAALVDGESQYEIYRDGVKVTMNDVQPFDVATYDKATRVLSVSSAKITGRYDNVWPNRESPAKVTVMGAKDLPVLPMAVESLSKFKLGDTVTLLLTADGQVAGAVSAQTVKSDNLGILDESGEGGVKVTLLSGIKVEGTVSSLSAQKGELVRVSPGTKAGQLYVSKVSGTRVPGDLDLTTGKIGDTLLSTSCRIFEKVGNSAMAEVKRDNVLLQKIPSSKLAYAHTDTNGRVDVLVLEDVTGDLYTYGILKNGTPQTGGTTEMPVENRTVQIYNHDYKDGSTAIVSNMAVPSKGMTGIVATADGSRIAGSVTLTEETGVRRSSFTTRNGKVYVTLGTQEMRVADNVQCYNKTTGLWMDSLDDARAFSDNITVYYDRTAKEGGKVRVVMVQ